jgi:hypothetical protein
MSPLPLWFIEKEEHKQGMVAYLPIIPTLRRQSQEKQ